MRSTIVVRSQLIPSSYLAVMTLVVVAIATLAVGTRSMSVVVAAILVAVDLIKFNLSYEVKDGTRFLNLEERLIAIGTRERFQHFLSLINAKSFNYYATPTNRHLA